MTSAVADRLLAAVRATPRRHLLPALPADAQAARALGPEAMVAFALAHGAHGPDAGELFVEGLQQLVQSALAGDPDFQAQVLRAQSPQVAEYVLLMQRDAALRRTLRALVDPVAHPGKLRGRVPGPMRDQLATLHRLASEADVSRLRGHALAMLAHVPDATIATSLESLLALPALAQLERLQTLAQQPVVRHYLDLVARRGPAAGSSAAAAQGREAAAAGAHAEARTLVAFEAIAQALGARVRAVHALHLPPGFPGRPEQAKDEWDVALVDPAGNLLLLAEVKASPAAASGDLPRLLRGLQRLAQADAALDYRFPCGSGDSVLLHGASLRALQPHGQALPPQVIYCSPAAPEARPPLLAPVARAMLLAQAASHPQEAQRVWKAVTTQPRLLAVLHQYETAQAVRAAMLDPDELLATLLATGR